MGGEGRAKKEERKKQRGDSPPKQRKRGSVALHKSVREIEALEARIQAGAPRSGSNPLADTLTNEKNPETGFVPYSGAKLFDQLPLSDLTRRGLKDANYRSMTDIQRASLPHALCGRDVLGAAKTGSGKTLAFIIPMIERLYRLRWGSLDGIGALVISPTRELAVQIFEELRKVGRYHSLSGGLLIGGRKDVDSEKERVNGLNILVCTPGRLLQHMHETVNFDCSQLQLLVLDEADRILDMGFSGTLNQILDQLPKERQTFLFSATQTRSVQDLGRLSLKSPEYLDVHAESAAATPARLQQSAMIIPLDQKMDTLWSFIKTHLRAKILVFLSSCKQVKFVHEAFKHLRPGLPIACLHGRLKQDKRLAVFYKFVEAEYAVLFATDIAARGLDFPTVDWVVQADCPEDVATYIHRVGRTARYTSSGRSLLLLAPSEAKMLTLLKESKIPIKLLKPNESKIQRVSQSIGGLLSRDSDLKYMAQRAFTTYLRSIYLQRDKEIFDVQKLPVAEYAASLGLPSVPRVRFLKKGQSDSRKNVSYALKTVENDPSEGGQPTEKPSKLDRLFNRVNSDVLSASHEKQRAGNDDDDDEDDEGKELFQKKRPIEEEENGTKPSNPKKKKLRINPSKTGERRLVFDEEGNALPPLAALSKESKESHLKGVDEELAAAARERYKKLQQDMKRSDKEDRLLERQRLRDKRLKKKQQLQEASREEELEAPRLRDAGDELSDDEDDEEEEGGEYDRDYSADEEEKYDEKDASMFSLSLADQEALALKLLNSRN